MIDLSIAIVAYNDYKDIINALVSLEKFTSREILKKVYIIDNSSKNDKFIIDRNELKNVIDSFDDVEYVDTGNNLGFGKGNNFIIPKLESTYHAIVNPDIIFIEDAFKPIIEFMNKTNAGMCIPKIVDEDDNIQLAYRRDPTLFDMFTRFFFKKKFKKRSYFHTLQDKDFTKPFQVPFGQGSFLVIKTDLFIELNGFDDNFFMYLEDADLCRRVNQISKVLYCPYAKVVHKWERASHKNFKLFKIHFKSMCLYFKKWGIKII